VVVVALAVGGYLYYRLDDEIRRQVERLLANHYREFEVHVGAARFESDHGIGVYNVALSRRGPDGKQQTVLLIDEMYLAGKIRAEQLITSQLPIDEITIRRARLQAVQLSDGSWNTRGLVPLPHFSEGAPRIAIEDATLSLERAAASDNMPGNKPWLVEGIHLKLLPLDSNALAGAVGKQYHLEGTATGLPARELRVEGRVGVEGDVNAAATIVGLEVSPQLFTTLPLQTNNDFTGIEFSGLADISLQFNQSAASPIPAWSAIVNLDRGRFNHPILPEPLTDVRLAARADRNRLVVEQFDGRCGSATVQLALNRAGWTADAPMALATNVVGLMLDEKVQSRSPSSLARIWQRFRPIGQVDAEIRATFDGKTWSPYLTARCRGISLTDAERFPYVIERTTGDVTYVPAKDGKPDQLRMKLVGEGGGRPVHVDAELTQLPTPHTEQETTTSGSGVAADEASAFPGARAVGYRGVRYVRSERGQASHPLGWVKVSGTDVPLHEQLMAAIPDDGERLVRSLQPQGAVDFQFTAEWKDANQAVADKTLEISLKDCRVRYEKFPYPLQHVQGRVTANNWHWVLHDIEGRGANESTIVKCRGESVPSASGYQCDIAVEATNVPLDDILKSTLTPARQQLWDDLRPQGYVSISAHALRQNGRVEPEVEVALAPQGNSVSIEPRTFFPYRLERVQGAAHSKSGQVELRNLIGYHDRTAYSASAATWQPNPEGGWQFSLTGINVDRLNADREFVAALPPALQSAIERLQPSGTFGLINSSLSFLKAAPSSRLTSAWDINLGCQQAAIQGAFPLRGINGEMRLVGRDDGTGAATAGELSIDSLVCNDFQLTNVHGPLWVDSSRCLLGEPASRLQGQPLRRMTADAYGGSLATNIELLHGDNPSYNVDLHLGGANLARFVNERLGGTHEMGGTVSGTLVLAGTGRSTQTLRGSGELHVVDANIYELPPLVAMLKVLYNRPPDVTAFNRCDMQFAIQGEHLHFQQLNLLGDAVSLYGNGDADLNRRLDLVFYTLIGRFDQIPFWKTISGHVSKQTLQLKVVGTFEDPKIERKALPVVNDMLQQIQTELQEGASTMTPSPVTTRPPAR
jgi:hypothetical protein